MQRLFILLLTIFIGGYVVGQVKTQKITYNNWENSIQLTNDKIKIIVVPQIGRIIYFSYLKDENLLYENQELKGEVYSAENPYTVDGEQTHAGFGGDRIWPTIQDLFVHLNGDRGLSDQWIDGSPWKYEMLENGVKITSRISETIGAKVTRIITLPEKGAVVNIQQKMEKIKLGAKENLEPISLTIWNLSKIKNPLFGVLPLSKKSIFENSIEFQKWPDNINSAPKNYSRHGDAGQLIPVADLFQKMGTDSKGWVAGVYDDMVFGQFFIFDKNETYPDGGTSATIFTCTNFTELECLSPEKKLKPGESIQFDIQWKLKKIQSKKPGAKRKEAVNWLNNQLK